MFIVSDMGTGKSKQLKAILEEKVSSRKNAAYRFETVICLSFRKTFSVEFAKKFKLDSYEKITGSLDIDRNPRMIIQVDSLMRLDLKKFPQLLIIDEIESVLSKLPSCSNTGAVYQAFLELLRNSQNVVIMDGLMEQKTIEYLKLLSGKSTSTVVLNTFKPRNDYTMIVHPYKRQDAQFIVDLFWDRCGRSNTGSKVYGMITSYRLGEFVRQSLIARGVRVVYYHGENGLIETSDDSLRTQQQMKQDDFEDVNTVWMQYQVVLHTSTVTAGISFEEKYFDYQINVFNTQTCDSGSFFQGIHRVRNIASKEIITFVETDFVQQITSPAAYSNIEMDLQTANVHAIHIVRTDIYSQFVAWLKAREGCL